MSITYNICISEFENLLKQLNILASNAAAHKRKFEYAVDQFLKFLRAFNPEDRNRVLTRNELECYNDTLQYLKELHDLISSHQLTSWAQNTLENSCNLVPTRLCTLAMNLNRSTSVLSETASENFDENNENWLRNHIYDLKQIQASFTQYKDTCPPNDDLLPLVNTRLNSLGSFLKMYENDKVPAGSKIFSAIPLQCQTCVVDIKDFEFQNEIGSGVSAVVFYGIDKRNNNKVAIKKLKFKQLEGQKLQSFQREVTVLATAKHPCLVGFVGATNQAPYCIITEWMPGDTLYHEIHHHKKHNQTVRSIMAFDIARGMQFLHSKCIIHRDLKSLNILLDEKGRIKICDFGFSRKNFSEDELYTKSIGTPHWMAPELIEGNSYNVKIDVYSFGIVLWELVSGCVPYSGLDAVQITAQVSKGIRPIIPSHCNKAVRNLITDCWDKDPTKRPDFNEILKRFKREKIVLNGADINVVMDYIEAQTEQLFAIDKKLEPFLKQTATLEEIIDILSNNSKHAISDEYASKFWQDIENLYQQNKNINPELFGQAFLLFLTLDSFKQAAASRIRSLPPNSIRREDFEKVIEKHYPSGLEEFNDDLAISACKNNCAEIILIESFKNEHLVLAMEIVCQQGVSPSYKTAIADRCYQCLEMSSDNKSLVCAALRCLIGISEEKRIPVNKFKYFLEESNVEIRNCALVAAASMSHQDLEVPRSVLDYALKHMNDESLSVTVIISACRNPKNALYILGSIKPYIKSIKPENLIRILLASASNRETLRSVKELLKIVDFQGTGPDIQRGYSKLVEYIDSKYSK